MFILLMLDIVANNLLDLQSNTAVCLNFFIFEDLCQSEIISLMCSYVCEWDASQYAGLDFLAERFSFYLVMALGGVGRGHQVDSGAL